MWYFAQEKKRFFWYNQEEKPHFFYSRQWISTLIADIGNENKFNDSGERQSAREYPRTINILSLRLFRVPFYYIYEYFG